MTPHKAYEAALSTARALDIKHDLGHQLENSVENVQWYEGYADGREAPKGIVSADWNDPDRYDSEKKERVDLPGKLMSRLCTIFEKMGVEIEWSDMITTCDECGLVVQTEPDGWGWQPEFVEGEGSITCAKCLENDEESYLESIEGTTKGALSTIDPTEYGYVCIAEDLERGWHDGQDADPSVIAKALQKRGISRFLFQIDDVRQFDASFSVYVHEDEAEKVAEGLATSEVNGPSVSGAMKRFFEAAAKAMREHE